MALEPTDSSESDQQQESDLFDRAPGTVFHAAVVAAGLALLWSASDVGLVGLDVGLAAFAALGLAGMVWVGWVLVFLRRGHRSRRFVIAPAALAVVCALVAADAPAQARFAASAPALAARAEAVLRGEEPVTGGYLGTTVRIGGYDICRIVRVPGGVVFEDCNAGFIYTHGGFAYLPAGQPEEVETSPPWNLDGLTLEKHLWGPWYEWSGHS